MNDIQEDSFTPSIYAEGCPPVPLAYFTGPWLPMSHVDRFVNYSLGLRFPLHILEDKTRRERISRGLIKLLSDGNLTQQDLFATPEKRLEDCLDSLLRLREEGKRFYSCWKQQVGKKVRNLAKPNRVLDYFLNEYVKPIVMQMPCHSQCHGGEKGWDVQRSLAQHVPLGSVLSFDLESAFNNVDSQYVFDCFYRNIFGTLDEETAKDISGFLTHLVTIYSPELERAVLPQGSSISMSVFNRLFYPIDDLIHKGATTRGMRYTRWVDDLILSAPETNRNVAKMADVVRLVRTDFPVSLRKIFFQQDRGTYYLLGNQIVGKLIFPVKQEESKNRGRAIEKCVVQTEHEWFIQSPFGDAVDTPEDIQEEPLNPLDISQLACDAWF